MTSLLARGLSISSLLSNGGNNPTIFQIPTQRRILGLQSSVKKVYFSGGKGGGRSTPPPPKAPTPVAQNSPFPEPSKEKWDKVISQLTARLAGKTGKFTNELLVYAVNANALKQVETDINWLIQTFQKVPALKTRLRDRSRPREPIIESLVKQGKLHPLTKEFLLRMDKAKFFPEAKTIFSNFLRIAKDYRKEIDIEVVTAKPLKPVESEILVRLLKNNYLSPEAKPIVTTAVNPKIVEGFKAKVGQFGIDFSGQTALQKRETKLASMLANLNTAAKASERAGDSQNEGLVAPEIKILKAKLQKSRDLVAKDPNNLTLRKQLYDLELIEKFVKETNLYNSEGNLHDLMNFVRQIPLLTEDQWKAEVNKIKAQKEKEAKKVPLISPKEWTELAKKDGKPKEGIKIKEAKKQPSKVDVTTREGLMKYHAKKIRVRVAYNKIVDGFLYRAKMANWKHIVSELEDGPEKDSYQRAIQLFEKFVGKVNYTPPAKPYSFSKLKSMTVDELVEVPLEEIQKLSPEELKALPLKQMKEKISEQMGYKPVNLEEVRKKDISQMQLVDIDVILMELNDNIRINRLAKEFAIKKQAKAKKQKFDANLVKLSADELKEKGIVINKTWDNSVNELLKAKSEIESKVKARGFSPLPDRL